MAKAIRVPAARDRADYKNEYVELERLTRIAVQDVDDVREALDLVRARLSAIATRCEGLQLAEAGAA